MISCDWRNFQDGGRGGLTLSTDDGRPAPGTEPADESRATERLTTFSDAVVAIAITLLAIDLPVPGGNTVPEFWTQVRHNDGHYAAFLISFVVIAGARGVHHDIFRYVKRTDARLREYNTAWLLTIVLIPFATRLLDPTGADSSATRALRFGFYALLQVLESGTLFVMLRHVTSYELAPDFPRPAVAAMAWRSWSVVVAFALSIPVFFVTVNAWVLWIVIPLLIDQVRRHHPRSMRHDR